MTSPLAIPVQLETVDVFETVLVRMTGHPEALFLALGRLQRDRGLTAHSPEVIAEVRRVAESTAVEQHAAHADLADVYAELAWRLGLDERSRDDLQRCELELEAELLRPVPGADRWLHALRAAPKGVAFVSDSYLSSAFIRAQLQRCGLWDDRDRLYVSCEAGETKWSGRLFPLVARREGVRTVQMRHHGNHARSDVRSARRRAVQVSAKTVGNPNRYERVLDGHGTGSGGLAHFLSGAARMARLDVEGLDDHAIALRDVGACVVAPALAAYVLHVLRSAERAGIRRLYFAAREGEVLLEVARPLAALLGCSIELRHLHGSRQAWNAAALTELDDEAFDWILQLSGSATVRTVLQRVGLSPERVGRQLSAMQLPPSTWDETLVPARREALRQALGTDPCRSAVLADAHARRTLMLQYLRQEGLLDGTPYGVVDVGWKGRTASSLSSVLAGVEGDLPACFYSFALQDEPPSGRRADRRAFLFDGGRNLGAGRLTVSMATIDVFCAGREGLTIGYEVDGEQVRPVRRSATDEAVLQWGLLVVREAVGSFARQLVLDPRLVDLDGDLRPAVLGVLQEFLFRPTTSEARAWGSFPHASDQDEADRYPLARPVPLPVAARAVATGVSSLDWAGGSRRLSSAASAALLGRPYRLTRRLRAGLGHRLGRR